MSKNGVLPMCRVTRSDGNLEESMIRLFLVTQRSDHREQKDKKTSSHFLSTKTSKGKQIGVFDTEKKRVVLSLVELPEPTSLPQMPYIRVWTAAQKEDSSLLAK